MPDAEGGDVVAEDGAPTDDEHEDPRGTMVRLLLFLALIVVMWIWAYYSLIVRG